MNNLENFLSPEKLPQSKVDTSNESEKEGRLKGIPVSKSPDLGEAKKTDVLAKQRPIGESAETAKKNISASLEKSQYLQTTSEKIESSQQEYISSQKEIEKSIEEQESLLQLSIAEKMVETLYQQARSAHDKQSLESIKSKVEHLQQDIHLKFSSQTLQQKFKQILEEINEMDNIFKVVEMMKKGESMQGYPGEVLSYEGYQLLKQIKSKQAQQNEKLSVAEKKLLETSENYEKAIMSVKQILHKAQVELIKETPLTKLKDMSIAIKAGTAPEDVVKLAVDCKRIWMNLATEEGSYLEILNFIGKKDFEGLEIIKEIAFMQGPQVDMMLNQAILEDHMTSRPIKDSPMKVLVEGAGPNGLYAALQFFRSGASISVVNNRSERVIRNQNMILDPKWIAQLNFLLGSKFDELFVDPKALGVLNPQRGSGTIKTRMLEDVMKVRAVEISSYIKDKTSLGKDTFLNLHFEAPLKGVQPSDKGFFAIIGPAKTSPDAERFKGLAIEKLTKKILSSKYSKYQPEDRIDQETVFNKAQAEAKAQWDEEQIKIKKEPVVIVFDFLACIGGANDKIRDEYLEPAVPLTSPKNYGIASWLKPESQANVRYFSQDKLNLLNVKLDQLGYPYLTRSHIEKSLRSQELDQFISSSNLPEEIKKKYQHLTEDLLKNIEINHLPNVESDQPICGFNIRTFENYATVFLAENTPPLLSEFLHDLDKLIIASSSSQEKELLQNFKKEIDRKWMNTLAGVFGIDPSVVKLDEEYLINFGTFDVVQKATTTAAKLLKSDSKHSSVVIAAFGDSRASPHFFSGSGMSTGRLGIEKGAQVIREFNREKIHSKQEFVENLNVVLDQAKEKAIEKGRRFVKPNSVSERVAARCLILKNQVNEYYNDQRKAELTVDQMWWKIENEVNDSGEFVLSFVKQTGKQQSLKVKINSEDGLLHANGRTYQVLNDLLLDLDNLSLK